MRTIKDFNQIDEQNFNDWKDKLGTKMAIVDINSKSYEFLRTKMTWLPKVDKKKELLITKIIEGEHYYIILVSNHEQLGKAFELMNEKGKIKTALEETIHKYDSDFRISNLLENPTGRFKTLVKMRWDNKFTELEFYFVVLLLWSYEHFAYNRRQSLKNVYEQCLSLSNGNSTNSEFKIALENYFRFNESSYLLQHIADNPHEFERWFDVFYEAKEDEVSEVILTTSELNAVKDQLSRFLESYMSNVGLNFISGVIRLILDDFDDPDGRNRLTSSLIVINDYSEHDRLKIIEQLLKIITPQLADKNKNELTMTMHEVFDDENILRVLNKHLNDEFSLSTLLEYKLNKIKGLTSLMKDTLCQFH